MRHESTGTRPEQPPIVDGIVEQALLGIAGRGHERIALREGEHVEAVYALRAMGALEPRQGSEFTKSGELLVEACIRYREAEKNGLPIELWNPERQPWALTRTQYEAAAIYRSRETGKTGALFHSNGRLMVRGKNPRWGDDNAPVDIPIDGLLDGSKWDTEQVKPIGYCFTETDALIAFDIPGTVLRADYFEIARQDWKPTLTWTAYYSKDRLSVVPSAIRADAEDTRGVAYIAGYNHAKRLKGLESLFRKIP